MRKITFLTLVMILGMSSVSFGKEYLCISDVGVGLKFKNQKWEPINSSEEKFIVKTVLNSVRKVFIPSIKMYVESINPFGTDKSLCGGESDTHLYDYPLMTCYSSQVGIRDRTLTEFNFDLKSLKFQLYVSGSFIMNHSGGMSETYPTMFRVGECSEI